MDDHLNVNYHYENNLKLEDFDELPQPSQANNSGN